jgi:hypothetical protein
VSKKSYQKKGTLCWYALNCDFISIGYVSDGEWLFQAEIVWFVADECEVTHWMHLPPAPPENDELGLANRWVPDLNPRNLN